MADVELYARQGETQQAVKSLRQAWREGFRISWWSQAEQSPHNVSLMHQSEFKSIINDFKTEMGAQLKRVREMEPGIRQPAQS